MNVLLGLQTPWTSCLWPVDDNATPFFSRLLNLDSRGTTLLGSQEVLAGHELGPVRRIQLGRQAETVFGVEPGLLQRIEMSWQEQVSLQGVMPSRRELVSWIPPLSEMTAARSVSLTAQLTSGGMTVMLVGGGGSIELSAIPVEPGTQRD